VACLVFHYIVRRKLNSIKKLNLESEGFNTNFYISLVAELLICCPTSLPNVNVKFTGNMLHGTYTYHLTDVIMIIMMARCYLFLRLYEHYSKWTSFRSYTVCKKYGTTADAFFALKSDLKDRPFITIALSIILLTILYGVAVQQSEKSFTLPGGPSGMDQLTNNEWLVIITMTTVGYGDFYPCTHPGRFFCLMACVSGMILISSMVVALNLASEFSKDQSIAYLAIKTKGRELEWFASAAQVVKAAFRTARAKDALLKRFRSVLQLKKQVFHFKRTTQLNSMMDITSAEMLYDLQHKLEEKLLATKTIICDIPKLEERCWKMKQTQKVLDEKIERVMDQQRIIQASLDISY
jgi:hypothetical protein